MANSLPELVAESLNNATFSINFLAAWQLYPDSNTADLDATKVSIFDGPRSSSRGNRREFLYSDIVYIVVQKQVDANTPDGRNEVRRLLDLLREIEAHFENLQHYLGGVYDFIDFDESTERLPFSLDEMRTSSVFSTVVGLRFNS